MVAFADCLASYDIDYVGSLWTRERGTFPTWPGIYVLVAPNGIEDFGPWVGTATPDGSAGWQREVANETAWIEPSEIFYVGLATRSLRERLHNYRKNARKGLSISITHRELTEANRHRGTYILRMAYQQQVPIDVYARYVSDKLIYFEELPIGLLAGLEVGLIRQFDPKGNRQYR